MSMEVHRLADWRATAASVIRATRNWRAIREWGSCRPTGRRCNDFAKSPSSWTTIKSP